MGMTFMDYVYAIRLEHAYYDVINTDFPIGSIADHHGFEKKLQAFCPQIQKNNTAALPERKGSDLKAPDILGITCIV